MRGSVEQQAARPAGLTTVTLDAAALAHGRMDDIRIVDGARRQIPYVIEPPRASKQHTLHGWRAAFATLARDAGFARDVVELTLDHVHDTA